MNQNRIIFLLNNRIPENFSLRSLTQEHVNTVKSAWRHDDEFSINTVSYLIEHNVSVGLFNESNDLVAWCLVFDFGSLAALQVDEKHYRKGYGTIVTKALSKKIAMENGVDITSNFVDGNVKSQNLVEKIGFKQIDKNLWVKLKGKYQK